MDEKGLATELTVLFGLPWRWRALYWFHGILGTFIAVWAVMLGGSLVAAYVPELTENATWLSRATVWLLKSPDIISSWLIPHIFPNSPKEQILLSLIGLTFVADLIASGVSPIFKQMFIAGIARAARISVEDGRSYVRQNRSTYLRAKYRALGKRTLRTLAFALKAFFYTICAGGFAWAMTSVIALGIGWGLQALIAGAVLIGAFIVGMVGDAIKGARADRVSELMESYERETERH